MERFFQKSLFTEILDKNRVDLLLLYPRNLPILSEPIPYERTIGEYTFRNPHPVVYAILTNKPAILWFYLDADPSENAPLYHVHDLEPSTGLGLIHIAILSRNRDCLHILLKENGAQSAGYPVPPVKFCISLDFAPGIELFLQYRVCFGPQNDDLSVLREALDRGNPDIIKPFLKWLAFESPDLLQKFMSDPYVDSKPFPPVAYFLSEGRKDIADLLWGVEIPPNKPASHNVCCICPELPVQTCHICGMNYCVRHLRSHRHLANRKSETT
jgi:hypothetical protein